MVSRPRLAAVKRVSALSVYGCGRREAVMKPLSMPRSSACSSARPQALRSRSVGGVFSRARPERASASDGV